MITLATIPIWINIETNPATYLSAFNPSIPISVSIMYAMVIL